MCSKLLQGKVYLYNILLFCTALSILLTEWIITVEYVEEIVELIKKYNIHSYIYFCQKHMKYNTFDRRWT